MLKIGHSKSSTPDASDKIVKALSYSIRQIIDDIISYILFCFAKCFNKFIECRWTLIC